MATVLSAPRVILVSLDKIKDSPDNVRETIGDLTTLAESIRERGLLNPVTLSDDGDGTFTIVAGHRRVAAVRKLGAPSIPSTLREIGSDADRIADMLVENLQRENLSTMEEARAMQKLTELGWKQREISKKIGYSQPVVSKRLALMDLPTEVQDAVDAQGIAVQDALALADLKDDPDLLLRVFNNRAKGNIGFLIEQARTQQARAAEPAQEKTEDELLAAKTAAARRRILTKAVRQADEDRFKAIRALIKKRVAKGTMLDFTLDNIIRMTDEQTFRDACALVGVPTDHPGHYDLEAYLAENEEDNHLKFAYALVLAKGHGLLVGAKVPVEGGHRFAVALLEHLDGVGGYDVTSAERYLTGAIDIGEVSPPPKPEKEKKTPKGKAQEGAKRGRKPRAEANGEGEAAQVSEALGGHAQPPAGNESTEAASTESDGTATHVQCPDCVGTGIVPGTVDDVCQTCDGDGWVEAAATVEVES